MYGIYLTQTFAIQGSITGLLLLLLSSLGCATGRVAATPVPSVDVMADMIIAAESLARGPHPELNGGPLMLEGRSFAANLPGVSAPNIVSRLDRAVIVDDDVPLWHCGEAGCSIRDSAVVLRLDSLRVTRDSLEGFFHVLSLERRYQHPPTLCEQEIAIGVPRPRNRGAPARRVLVDC